ncbi:MAG: hypothetical protein JO005_00090 [Gammaproteobacteria bacterium]|nr:hypothetical protein [Gammaproteobacteria bacterium]
MHRWSAALGATAVAAFGLYRCLARLQRHRLIADTSAVRLRSAAQGYVKLRGRAGPVGTEPTRAPLSGRPCVWWSYEVAREEEQARNRWETLESAASVELFVLTDEDGSSCLVGPVRAEITPTRRDVWYGEEARPAGPPPSIPPPFRYRGYRYTESLLEVGALLSVLGELRSHSEGTDAGRSALEKLRAWKADQSGLLARFDANHDGRIDEQEWEAARRAAFAEAQAPDAPIVRVSVISQPASGAPFLIAPLTAAHLVRRELWMAVLYLLAGIGGVVLLGWVLSNLT